jgi:hypothetical protein
MFMISRSPFISLTKWAVVVPFVTGLLFSTYSIVDSSIIMPPALYSLPPASFFFFFFFFFFLFGSLQVIVIVSCHRVEGWLLYWNEHVISQVVVYLRLWNLQVLKLRFPRNNNVISTKLWVFFYYLLNVLLQKALSLGISPWDVPVVLLSKYPLVFRLEHLCHL